MPKLTRQQKITFAEMRGAGVRGLLVYCADYNCAHAVRIIADRWPDHIRLSDLEDAGKYITKLPKADHEAQEWQAAMEALMLVATSGGPTMFARIGVMRALNRHVERVFNPDRKDHHWGRRKLARKKEAENRLLRLPKPHVGLSRACDRR